MGCILHQHAFATFKNKKKKKNVSVYVLCWHDFPTQADCIIFFFLLFIVSLLSLVDFIT